MKKASEMKEQILNSPAPEHITPEIDAQIRAAHKILLS